eukprot:Pgem_evm2s19289
MYNHHYDENKVKISNKEILTYPTDPFYIYNTQVRRDDKYNISNVTNEDIEKIAKNILKQTIDSNELEQQGQRPIAIYLTQESSLTDATS